LMTAGRSRTTIKRYEAEFNAFAGFLEARGRALPTEADCLDFVAERSGCRLAGLREPTGSRPALLARRPLILPMEGLGGGVPEVGQATTPAVERCPARFRVARDEYLAACRRRGNAEASVVTKQRAADQFLAYLEEVGREPWIRRRPKTWPVFGPGASGVATPRKRPGRCVRRWLTSCATCTRVGRSQKIWPGGCRLSAIPAAASRLRTCGRLGMSAWCWARSTGNPRSGNATTRMVCV
jgi:hypothetical protein